MGQKLCQVVLKIALFFIYGYVMPLEWHVNHDKLCFMTNMDVKI
jgi:hypothetical protein